MKKKLCVISGSRAEYGLLQTLLKKIQKERSFQLQLIITGMHLSPEFGLTYKEIEKDGFVIDEKIESLLSSDTSVGISKSIGLGIMGFSETFQRLQPDMVIVLGDRFEIFAAASAAMIARIPITHLHGGESTVGAYDESIRHAITKMSQLHFTSTEAYRNRVIQLGEHPDTVFNVGAIGLDNIQSLPLLKKSQLETELKYKFGQKNILVTFHPVTLEANTSSTQFQQLLKAISQLSNIQIIFTKANADSDGRIINQMIDTFVRKNPKKSIVFTSLGQKKYLSTMKYMDAIVGNSSSGIIEAPSFKVPTVNIGDRQKGRILAESVIQCDPNTNSILKAINTAFSKKFISKIKKINNPYGKGNTSEKIIAILKKKLVQKNSPLSVKKNFYDLIK